MTTETLEAPNPGSFESFTQVTYDAQDTTAYNEGVDAYTQALKAYRDSLPAAVISNAHVEVVPIKQN